MSMNDSQGERRPSRESPSSLGSMADWNVVTISQMNIPTMIPERTRKARRRLSTHAPTVYIEMKMAMLPT